MSLCYNSASQQRVSDRLSERYQRVGGSKVRDIRESAEGKK